MWGSKLIRWCGLAFAVSGPLFAAIAIVHPDVPKSTFARALLGDPYWVAEHVASVFAAVLMLFGLIGLYARQVERTAILGLSGFLMAFVGLVVAACLAFFEAFLMPVFAAESPEAFDWDGPFLSSPLVRTGLALVVLYPMGFSLFGIATMRAGVLPRAAALLLTIAVPLAMGLEGPFVPVLGMASMVVLAVAHVWLGYALWSGKTEEAALRLPQRPHLH